MNIIMKRDHNNVIIVNNIDKEILKIVTNTIKIYNFKDFTELELNNLLTSSKVVLNRAAVWAGSTDEKR